MWIFLQEINASRPVIGHMTNIMVTLYFYHASNEGRPMKHSKMVNAVYSCTKHNHLQVQLVVNTHFNLYHYTLYTMYTT